MAGWYVRRGEKVIGPIESAQLKKSAADGKLLPTDQIAKDAAGPWTEAEKTSLFTKPQESQTQISVPPITQLPATTTPQEITDASQKPGVISVAKESAKTIFISIGGYLSNRAQRKHELKMAEAQARAQATQGSGGSPVITQTTVVKVVNRNGGCGCSGCATIILLIVLALIGYAIYSANVTPG